MFSPLKDAARVSDSDWEVAMMKLKMSVVYYDLMLEKA
jgi:hypothetical protein